MEEEEDGGWRRKGEGGRRMMKDREVKGWSGKKIKDKNSERMEEKR